MAAALPFLQIAGTVMSVIGALNQASAKSSAADYNAAMAERNATIARQQGEADMLQAQRVNAMRLGSIKAGYGSSGLTLEGSPLDVLESSAAQAKLDEQNIMYGANLRAQGFSESANLYRSQASQARSGGLFDAAGKAILGGARAYESWRGTGTPVPMYGEDWVN